MQSFQKLFNRLLRDIEVELSDEFDRNFERKAFFSAGWKSAIHGANRGSLLIRTSALRKSLRATVAKNTITWESSLPYADIHNKGGKIIVTKKMKGFFWYQYRLATGGNNKNENPDALFWKSMALKRVGSTIVIPQRQFIGAHPLVDQAVNDVAKEWFENDVKPYIDEQLNNMIK